MAEGEGTQAQPSVLSELRSHRWESGAPGQLEFSNIFHPQLGSHLFGGPTYVTCGFSIIGQFNTPTPASVKGQLHYKGKSCPGREIRRHAEITP